MLCILKLIHNILNMRLFEFKYLSLHLRHLCHDVTNVSSSPMIPTTTTASTIYSVVPSWFPENYYKIVKSVTIYLIKSPICLSVLLAQVKQTFNAQF